jgi:hypothetical protein
MPAARSKSDIILNPKPICVSLKERYLRYVSHYSICNVGCLRRVRRAISVARAVMDHTSHSLLVGDKVCV